MDGVEGQEQEQDTTLWLLLVAVAVMVVVAHLPGAHATAWHWFEDAVHLLTGSADDSLGPGGLHLYAEHPELQFGPLSIVVAVPLVMAGPWVAIIAGTALGLGAFAALVASVRRLRPDVDPSALRKALAVGGVVFTLAWGVVATRTAHIDDAIALAATALAVLALASGRPFWGALALGVAGAAKPWAVAFAPLALAPAGPQRWRRLLVTGGVVGLTWAPFVLAEPATLDTAGYAITNELSSTLRLLGVTDPTTPAWVRPAQLVGGFLLAAFLVRRGRWQVALMAAVAWRLLIDPAANRYYTIGLVLAVLVYELVERPRRLPLLAAATAVLLEASQMDPVPPTLGAWMRLAALATVMGVAFAAPLPSRPLGPVPDDEDVLSRDAG